jgi:hypothetical protein
MTRSAPGTPEVTPAVPVTGPSCTNRCPATQFTFGYCSAKAPSPDQWAVAVRPSRRPVAATTADPLQTPSTRAPARACVVIHARSEAS